MNAEHSYASSLTAPGGAQLPAFLPDALCDLRPASCRRRRQGQAGHGGRFTPSPLELWPGTPAVTVTCGYDSNVLLQEAEPSVRQPAREQKWGAGRHPSPHGPISHVGSSQ